jgi:hypothetical protein
MEKPARKKRWSSFVSYEEKKVLRIRPLGFNDKRPSIWSFNGVSLNFVRHSMSCVTHVNVEEEASLLSVKDGQV